MKQVVETFRQTEVYRYMNEDPFFTLAGTINWILIGIFLHGGIPAYILAAVSLVCTFIRMWNEEEKYRDVI